ncbi:MAG: ribosome hibernation-promoting factor, HPF/YfiA family [Chlamydiales bacterium]
MEKKTRAQVRMRYEDAEYPIHIVGRHIEVTESMKKYAIEKLLKIERFGGRVVEATISIEHQKLIYTVSFIITVYRTKIKVSAEGHDYHAAVDRAIDRLRSKLGRYVDKLHHHHTKALSEIDMHINVVQGPIPLIDDINDQIEEENLKEMEASLKPGQIVSKKKRPLKILTTEEAIMKLELTENNFLVYRSEEDNNLKVIYRRRDHNYGIIDLPE